MIRLLFAFLVVAQSSFGSEFRVFLENYCLECHDAASAKGELDLSQFTDEGAVMTDRAVWRAVFEKVESHQMPPPKRKVQPTDEERQLLMLWIKNIAGRFDPVLGAPDPGRAVVRRLTRLEFNNTVRDLFGLDRDVLAFPERLPVKFGDFPFSERDDLKFISVPLREYGVKYPVLLGDAGLPGDNRVEHGFSNQGDGMNVSPLQLERYVQMAHEMVNTPRLLDLSPIFRALVLDPSVSTAPATVNPAEAVSLQFSSLPDFAPKMNVPFQAGFDTVATAKYHFRIETKLAHEEGTGGVWQMEGAARRLEAGQPFLVGYGAAGKALVIRPAKSLKIGGAAGVEATSGRSVLSNAIERDKNLSLDFSLSGTVLPEELVALGVCVLSRKGQSGKVQLTVIFDDDSRDSLGFDIASGGGVGNTLFAFRAPEGRSIRSLEVDGSRFAGDVISIDDLGFLTEVRADRVLADGDLGSMSRREKRREAERRLAAFLPKVFRGPLTPELLKRYVDVVDDQLRQGARFDVAMKAALAAAFSSPHFIFLKTVSAGEGVIARNPYDLASRLSYFLWASCPDDLLWLSADRGLLSDPAELERQAMRMLRDPRARELVECFAVQWLRLDQLATAKPDPELFPVFYSGAQGKNTLHGPMLVEALLLFKTVMIWDRSILDFINADYTWLNPRLANFYGIGESTPLGEKAATKREMPKTDNDPDYRWTRVKLRDELRGGYLTMGAPLVLTSLPYRTSPVKRGAWLLETLFNRPPSEPKIAFTIRDDTKQSAQQMSIRERFEAHRNKAECYSCHIRLDPPGFALERFNPVGQWRTLDGGLRVDASSEWAGVTFDGPKEFKALLTRKPEEFVRGFIEHLLRYALNRRLEVYDMPVVDQIESSAGRDGWRFSAIIRGIVSAYPFTHTRGSL